MKSQFLEKEFIYDGTQLCSLFAYKNYGLLGDSVVSWVGECNVQFEHMVDFEDLRAQEKICGKKMLHFIFEIFDKDLTHAVFLQRLFAATVQQEIQSQYFKTNQATVKIQKGEVDLILREGDDLYFNKGKLSISIASSTPVSQMIHFAVNITNEGTPVKTSCLNDLKILPKEFSLKVMDLVCREYLSIKEATQKVKPLS